MTINCPVGHKRDHLFLAREGWAKRESWKFKVVTFEPTFETGTMAGLMTLFGRHSEVWTNFRILLAESRPYWVQKRVLSARSHGVRKGQQGPWSAMVDAETGIWQWLGPGNTNMRAGWGGVLPARYTPPGTHPAAPPRVRTHRHRPGA